MGIRIIVALIVSLTILDVFGDRVLPPRAADALSLSLVLAIMLLLLGRVYAARREEYQTTRTDVAVARIGWRLALAALILSTAATLLTAWLWPWRPGTDFDVLRILWILQNLPAVALLTIFGTIALLSLSVLITSLAARHD